MARVPPGADLADAGYAIIGAIAMHRIQQPDDRPGTRIGVIGVGSVEEIPARIVVAVDSDIWGTNLGPSRALSRASSPAVRVDAGAQRQAQREARRALGSDISESAAGSGASAPTPIRATAAATFERVGDNVREGQSSIALPPSGRRDLFPSVARTALARRATAQLEAT